MANRSRQQHTSIITTLIASTIKHTTNEYFALVEMITAYKICCLNYKLEGMNLDNYSVSKTGNF